MNWKVRSGKTWRRDYVLIVPDNAALSVPGVPGTVWVSQRTIGGLSWAFSFPGIVLGGGYSIYQVTVVLTNAGKATVILRGWTSGLLTADLDAVAIRTAQKVAEALPEALTTFFGFRAPKAALIEMLKTASPCFS